MNLSEALIELSVASPEEVLDATARGELFGGDLVTNLLDVRALPEGQAQQALCAAYGLPAGPTGELPCGSGAAVAAVPRELALELGVYPMRLDGDGLLVIASSAPSPQNEERLRHAAGVPALRVQLALAPRVQQAIARDYGSSLDRRTRKLIARLEGSEIYHSSRAPEVFVDAPAFTELPRPSSILPVTFFGEWADLETPSQSLFAAETAPVPAVHRSASNSEHPITQRTSPSVPNLPAAFGAERRSAPRSVGRGKHRGPYTVNDAKLDLYRATKADELLQVYFAFAAQYFDMTACFTLQGARARLRAARGFSWMQPTLKDRLLTLSEHPSLASVSETGNWLLARLPTLDPELSASLGLSRDAVSLLLPVRVRERASLVLLGAFEEGDVTLDDGAELFGFAPLVSRAIEQLIVQRKNRGEDGRDEMPTHPASASGLPTAFPEGDEPQPATLPPVAER